MAYVESNDQEQRELKKGFKSKEKRWGRWFKCNFIPSHRNELPHLSIVLESVRYMHHPLNKDDLTYKNYREKSRHLSYVFLD